MSRRSLHGLAGVLLVSLILALATTGSAAAEWPERPITFAAVSPAGGATDMTARTLAGLMQKELGVPIAVQNMAGAVGAVATDWVNRQPRDGYAWLTATDLLNTQAVTGVYSTTWRDWHLWIATGTPAVISVRVDSPYTSLSNLVADMRERPGQIPVATGYFAQTWHLPMELLAQALDVKYRNITYEGGRPSIVAAIGGEVEAVVTGLAEQVDFFRSGELRPLAAFSAEPLEVPGYGTVPSVTDVAPDLRTFLPIGGYWGLALPHDTPHAVISRVDAAFQTAIESPEMSEFARSNSFTLYGFSGDRASQFVRNQTSIAAWILEDILNATERPAADFGIPKPDL